MSEQQKRAAEEPSSPNESKRQRTSAPSASSGSVSSSDDVIGIAICGGGRIGTIHVSSLGNNKRFKVLYCVDVVVEAAQRMVAASGNPECQAVNSVDAAVSDASVEAVVVCTPTATHVAYIKAALAAKKHVFCEKPVSMKHEEIAECFDLARQAGVTLYCGYQRRADRNFRALYENVRKGSIGQVQVVKSTSRDHPTPSINFLKISGGFMHDCCSHDIDLCRWIAGEDPVEVFAVGSCFRDDIRELDDIDTAVVTLKFPSGVLATIDISRNAPYGYDQRLEVHGSLGMVQTNNVQETSCVVATAAGITGANYHYSFPQRYQQAYAHEMDHFFDIIRNDATPYCTGEDCVRVAQIADAAERAYRTGKPVLFKK